ncbi:MAG: hypothetical protein ACI9H6_000759 [Patiriisocius sp.]|jgi:hypothetical protein
MSKWFKITDFPKFFIYPLYPCTLGGWLLTSFTLILCIWLKLSYANPLLIVFVVLLFFLFAIAKSDFFG